MADKKVSLKVYSQAGEKLSSISVNADIFGIEPNNQVVYDAIRVYRNNCRQATASTLTRSEVRGGGKKPWKQKGTGRARAGSSRSPLWVGGGNVFGPKGTQNYVIKQNKKEYRLALKSALTLRVDNTKVVDSIDLASGKTKDFVLMLTKLEATKKTLVVINEINDAIFQASRNIPNAKVIVATEVNVYDLIWASDVLYTKDAIKSIEEAVK